MIYGQPERTGAAGDAVRMPPLKLIVAAHTIAALPRRWAPWFLRRPDPRVPL